MGRSATGSGFGGEIEAPMADHEKRALRTIVMEKASRLDPTESTLLNVTRLQVDVGNRSSQTWEVERDLREVRAGVARFEQRKHEAGSSLEDLQLRLQRMRAQLHQSIDDSASAPQRRRRRRRQKAAGAQGGESGPGDAAAEHEAPWRERAADGFTHSLTFALLAAREAEHAARRKQELVEKEGRRAKRQQRKQGQGRGATGARGGGGDGDGDDDGDGDGGGDTLEEMERRALRDVREAVDAELAAEEMQLYESCFVGRDQRGGAAEGSGDGDAAQLSEDVPQWVKTPGQGAESGASAAAELAGKLQSSSRAAARTKAEEREAEKRRRVQRLQRARVQAVPPQAPMDVEVTAVTASTITLRWHPPVFDGGARVVDYQLRFSSVTSSKEGKRVSRTAAEMPPISLSCFALAQPVPGREYTLTNLAARSEYEGFSLCARNASGCGPWSEPLGRVRTKAAAEPDPPRHVHAHSHTGQSFVLAWAPPRCDGGSPVADYEVSLRFMRHAMIAKDGMRKAGGREEAVRTLRSGGACAVEVGELEGGARHWDVSVVAVSRADLVSAPTPPIEVWTLKPTRLEQLLHELRRATADPNAVIDSAFHTGVVQRWSRVEYIQTIKAEMETLGWSEEEEKLKHSSKVKAEQEAAARREGQQAADPTDVEHLLEGQALKTRYSQFKHRIAELHKRLRDARERHRECMQQRSELMGEVQRITTRMRSVKAELDRALVFQGPYIDSHVLHNRVQRFPTQGLREELARDYQRRLAELSSVKDRLLALEEEERARVRSVEAVEERIKERRAAFLLFAAGVKKTVGASQFLGRMRLRPLHRTFARWMDFVQARRDARTLLRRVFRRASKKDLALGFSLWRRYLVAREREDLEAAEAAGLGTRLLDRARKLRGEMEGEAAEVIAGLARTAEALGRAEYTAEQWHEVEHSVYWKQLEEARERLEEATKLETRLLDHRHRADVHFRNEEWELAARHYAAHADRMKDKRNAAGCTEALVGMAACYFEQGKFERSLIAGDQCLLMAQRLPEGTKRSEADALYWMGKAHAGRSRFREASRFLLRSMRTYIELQDRRKEGSACRELARVFGILREDAKAEMYEKRAAQLEREFYEHIAEAAERLTDMESRLMGVSAEVGKVLPLERVPRRVPVLRSRWKALKGIHLDLDTERRLLERDVWNFDQRLEVMRGQLAKAADARAAQLNPARLLRRKKQQEARAEGGEGGDGGGAAGAGVSKVEQRILREIAEQERIRGIAVAERERRVVRVRNIADEMGQLEGELRVETGELARRVHVRRPLRAVAFNKMNKETGDVFGTETAGVELFATAMHHDVAFFDLETAVCMSVLGGGDAARLAAEGRQGHTQAITALHFTGDILATGSVDGSIRCWIVDDSLAAVEGDEAEAEAPEAAGKKGAKKREAGGKRQKKPTRNRPPGNVPAQLDVERGGLPTSVGAVRHFADKQTLDRILAAENPCRLYQLMEGHSGSVWCLDSTDRVLVSGSADQTARVWSRRTAKCLRVIVGHRYTVRSVVALPSGVITAGQDGTIRVWRRPTEKELERERTQAREALERMGRLGGAAARVERGHKGRGGAARTAPAAPPRPPSRALRPMTSNSSSAELFRAPAAKLGQYFSALRMAALLKQHAAPLTCAEASPTNMVSADEAGEVIVWDLGKLADLKTGGIVRRVRVHEGSVLCLQFDELKVVSGGRDGAVVVVDILTGRKLQTLRGHEAPVVALQFDNIQLLTCSMDGVMRQWHIKSRDGAEAFREATDKFHIVAPGESIYDLANRYRVDIRQILAWNGLKDPKSELYGGRRVIVRRAGVQQQFSVDHVFGKVSREEEERARVRNISTMTSPLEGVLMRLRREEKDRAKEEEERERRERDRLAQELLRQEEKDADKRNREEFVKRMAEELKRAEEGGGAAALARQGEGDGDDADDLADAPVAGGSGGVAASP